MHAFVTAPQRPVLAVPPSPPPGRLASLLGGRRALWAWPLVLSLLLVLGVMGWLRLAEVSERDALRASMISDALSLDAQIAGRIEAESSRLKAVADAIRRGELTGDNFSRHTLILDGLRRFWITVTWLDGTGRIVAQAPDDATRARAAQSVTEDTGVTGHLSVGLPSPGGGAGLLIARFSPGEILRQKVPWWLARKYDVRLVDESGEIIAATGDGRRDEQQAWYRVPIGPSLPQAFLELSAREKITPWWQTLPMALMAGFVVLIASASWALRSQMRSVSRAERAWRTEVAWRSAMEDSLAVGIRARDLEGRLVYVNKTMADMVGFRPEELVGQLPPMPYWLPDELEQTMTRHRRTLAGQAPPGGYESRWMHRNGQVVDVMVYEAPLVDAQGRHIGWMASIVNITERKRFEERERRQADTMAHHARLTMLGEVASTLAHELNQPLSAIASYNAGVLNKLAAQPAPDPQLLAALQRVGEQAAHAGRIVKRIREFLTRREPQREPSDVNEVLRAAVALLMRDIERLQVTVQWSLAADLPPVIIDPVLIEQVVVNLVRNACDALSTVPGPRRIAITSLPAAGGEFVRVTVADNGPGLGGQDIEALGQPFYSTKALGMGMGLAICRSIVELHYGALDAQETAGGGATFHFSVPAAMHTHPAAMDEEQA